MPTGSTKQRARKRAQGSRAGGEAAAAVAPPPASPPGADGAQMSERAWTIATLAVLLVAAGLRLYALELKPMHHDEGVNGFFLTTLLREGKFRYNPANYHGPTLYYLTLPSVLLFGLNTLAVRLVTVVFGVGVVWLVLCLRRHVGAVGALSAAALVAVSPGLVFNSRYFIHEMLFVFFTLGAVVAALRFHDTGRPLYLMLSAASAAMFFATKETHFISAGVIALAALVAWGYARLTGGGRGGRAAAFADTRRLSMLLLAALLLFLFVNVLFYSSFFTHWKGVPDALDSLRVWTRTGTSDFHSKGPLTYVKWLWQEEAPILLLACAGAAAALFERRRNRFAVFAGAWGFGMLAAYTLIPYKTPWLMLNFTVPMAVAGGYAVERLAEWAARAKGTRAPALVVLGLAVAACAYQTLVLNFRQYDNDAYPYVYAHTNRETHGLLGEIERYAAREGTRANTTINIVSPDYWPLPWYFRDYKRVGFPGRLTALTDQVIVANESQLPQVQSQAGAEYVRIGDVYTLRPGVRLVLFVRRGAAVQ